nr:hypothetical protein [Actinomycetota bacterium]
AVNLLALRPGLAPEQVTAILTRSAVDAVPATGCAKCPTGRDALAGWGSLDVAAALRDLSRPLPPRDQLEPNDNAGTRAVRLWGQTRRFAATLDYWDDQNDVYAIKLRRGQPVYVGLRGPAGLDSNLILWRPGTESVDDLTSLERRAAQSAGPGPRENLFHRAGTAGWYFVQVKLGSPGAGAYRLTIVKTP